MFRYKIFRVLYIPMIAVMMVALSFVPGCGGSTISESVTITLPDGTQTEATLGSGVLSLANTTWAFYRGTIASGTPFVVIQFGPQGNLASFQDNTIAVEVFGDTLLFDGQRHDTAFAGLSYEAGTFGAETNDATGFAFVGEISAFVILLGQVADGTLDVSGAFDPNDPNTMTGTFSINIMITVQIPGVPAEDIVDTFAFIAVKTAG